MYPEGENKQEEFKALLNTAHQNLVCYLGKINAPVQLVLFMELALENLTTTLQRSEDPFPYHVQGDLCHDIAKGVAHLHSLGVIHKHLSSNNVLISVDGTAKVTDYAISYMIGEDELFRKDQMKAYMPPQFFEENRQYTEKWDTFSIGVLVIQICTRQYPKPGARTMQFAANWSPTGIATCDVLETVRRKNHLDLIDPVNPLRGIAEQSIANDEGYRPTAHEVSLQLASLRETYKYAESVGEVANNKSLKFKQVKQEKLDYRISRGYSTMTGNVVYMRTGVSMCSYDFMTQEWRSLPDCPHTYSSLEIIKGLLTAIGGLCAEYSNVTNELLCLINEKWEKGKFKPMPTKRAYTMSVCTDDFLVVAGGTTSKRDTDALNIVEVMDLKTMDWSRVNAILPTPLSGASVTIYGDKVFMLGGRDKSGKSKAAFVCKLSDLTTNIPDAWQTIAETPAYDSTCVTVQGQLIAVGGCDKTASTKSELIYMYDPQTNSWDVLEDMQLSAARSVCHVAALPGAFEDILIIGGGDIAWRSPSDIAERVIVRNWACGGGHKIPNIPAQ